MSSAAPMHGALHSDALMSRYLSGDALYGDDLGAADIEAWYRDEAEGYSSLNYDDAQQAVYHFISMGDWREPRPGLTRHERGIPLPVFERMVAASLLRVVKQTLVNFGPLARRAGVSKIQVYNSAALTGLDALLCRLTARNTAYHRRGLLQKFGPNSVSWVLSKT
jgi:hypothetical protein